MNRLSRTFALGVACSAGAAAAAMACGSSSNNSKFDPEDAGVTPEDAAVIPGFNEASASTRNEASKGPQIYVAPIVVSGGQIKSYPALYFWNQPELENNHTPAWDVFKLPGGVPK